MKRVLFVILLSAVVMAACTKSTESNFTTDCSGTAKTYASDVAPIIQASCATNSGCHASGSHEGPGALTSYQQVYNNRADIRSSVANGSMPRDGSLSAAQKNVILCWIDNGASNN